MRQQSLIALGTEGTQAFSMLWIPILCTKFYFETLRKRHFFVNRSVADLMIIEESFLPRHYFG